MNLVQSLAAPVSLSCGDGVPLDFSVTTELVTSASVSTPAADVFESKIVSDTTAGAWRKPFFSFPLDQDCALSSLTPATAAITDGEVAIVGSGGPARIKVTRGAKGYVYDCNVASSTATVTAFDGYVIDSVADTLATEILSRISGTEDMSHFTDYSPTRASGVFTLNPNSWTNGIDLSGVAIQTTLTGGWDHKNRGALIAERVVVGARHWSAQTGGYIGMKFRFRGSDGSVNERTVIGMSYNLFDSVFFLLDSAVPATVTPLKVVGEWFARNRTYAENSLSCYNGGVFFYPDQGFNCRLVIGAAKVSKETHYAAATIEANGNTYTENVWRAEFSQDTTMSGHTPAIFSGKTSYFHEASSGDSGSPVCALIAGEPCVVGTWFYPLTAPFLGESDGNCLNDCISDCVADAVSRGHAAPNSGITVTVAPDPTLP